MSVEIKKEQKASVKEKTIWREGNALFLRQVAGLITKSAKWIGTRWVIQHSVKVHSGSKS